MANSNPSGRPTKAERKDQARRERLELQRKMARARRNRRVLLGASALVIAAVAIFSLTRPTEAVATPDEMLQRGAQASEAAGCEEARRVDPFEPQAQDQAHVDTSAELPPLSAYPSVPPASGPHNPSPLGAGVYDSAPPIDRVIHSLEHGAAVVWYAPEAGGEALEELRRFYDQPSAGARVIVAPYNYPDQGDAGRLPSGTQMALVAWHHLEECAQVNAAAAFDFTSSYSAPPYGERPYLGEAPEAGAAI